MSCFKDKRGLTLIETVIYTGVISILLSSFLALSTRMVTVHARNSLRSRLAESAWLALNAITTDLETAPEILSSSSTFNTDSSVLAYRLSTTWDVLIDVETSTIQINGNPTDISRLHYLVEGLDSYLTDSDVDVFQWLVVPVRDSDGVLTGLNLTLGVEVIDRQSTGYRQGQVTYTTTVKLRPGVDEL